MTTATVASRLRPAVGALGRAVDAVTAHIVLSLTVVLVLQATLTVALFASVEHNGWLTYQGGDQLWLITSGWLLGQGILPHALVGPGWPVMLMPLTWIGGGVSIDLLPLTTVLQVGVLAPIATLAVYDIGARVAGRAAGLWCSLAWVLAPFLAIPLFVDRYQERWTDQVLVQALGLTQLADFPSLVLVLVAAALVVRSIGGGSYEAVLAGSLAGLAIAVKPANVLFLAGPALAYLLARRSREAALFALALIPALVTLAVWKQRGLGALPLFAAEEARVAVSYAAGVIPIGDSYWDRVPIHLEDWERNMSNLREFFWSARLAQWAPLAGALAVARKSLPAAGLLAGWMLGYVVVKGASELAGIENASFWRLVMPALPAYVMLAAAIPLLVPTLPDRLRSRIAPLPPARRPGTRLTVAVVAVLAVVPLVTVATASPLRGTEQAVVVNEILVPVDDDVLSLQTRKRGEAQVLTWTDETRHARTFYRVFRTQGPTTDVECERTGADRCELRMIELGTTRQQRWVDRSPEPGVRYRVGVAANWLDDPEQGDVVLVSAAVPAAT